MNVSLGFLAIFQVCQISAQKPVQEELVERYQNLSQRLSDIKLQNDEVRCHNTF